MNAGNARPESADKTEPKKLTLYGQVAARIEYLIERGTFRPGERIPSVRSIKRQMDVSLSTVLAAYGLLEDRGVIEARPQSGYYVCAFVSNEPLSCKLEFPSQSIVPAPLNMDNICTMLMGDSFTRGFVPLGTAIPNPALLPVDSLTRALGRAVRRSGIQGVSYDFLPGHKRLRTLISQRAMTAGCLLDRDEIVTTHGAMEAVTLSLRAVCRPGDTVAVESPIFYGFLQTIEMHGLRVLEIPTHPERGIHLDALAYAIEHNSIGACLIATNFSNPLGCCIPDDGKKNLVELLAAHNIPLIEDDVYGDLCFSDERPIVAKAFDRKGIVLLCSSFSKTVAPGYRVGWVAPGKFQKQVQRLKILSNIATTTPTQLAMAEFLASGGYNHHLRKIRRVYRKQIDLMARAVIRYFPEGTRVSRPAGGYVLWVEFPEAVDSGKLFESALKERITIAPGPIFSSGQKYRNCIRLNASFWSSEIEEAIATVGRLATVNIGMKS
ncbi:MAG: PLP-dependent aminotransferase family protein [Nitrospirae bacterium]|nr:PLP-dependent aminotransferase family protein [Nitrospirota bacterium]